MAWGLQKPIHPKHQTLKEVVMESITEQRFVDRLIQALASLPHSEPRASELRAPAAPASQNPSTSTFKN